MHTLSILCPCPTSLLQASACRVAMGYVSSHGWLHITTNRDNANGWCCQQHAACALPLQWCPHHLAWNQTNKCKVPKQWLASFGSWVCSLSLIYLFLQTNLIFFFDNNDNTSYPTLLLWASPCRVAMGLISGPWQVPCHTAPPPCLQATAHRGQWRCWWQTVPWQHTQGMADEQGEQNKQTTIRTGRMATNDGEQMMHDDTGTAIWGQWMTMQGWQQWISGDNVQCPLSQQMWDGEVVYFFFSVFFLFSFYQQLHCCEHLLDVISSTIIF